MNDETSQLPPQIRTPEYMRQLASRGGRARMAKLTPEQRSSLMRAVAKRPSPIKAKLARAMWKHGKRERRALIREGMVRKWEERRLNRARTVAATAFGKQV